VQADPTLIERVLMNLILNAIRVTPAGGEVQLSAARRADGVGFAVADSGIGISRDELGRIFERSYKADRSRASGGTGLGLAIAKHIVQAHGGRIWAESEGEGRGSTFRFVLPVATGATAADASDEPDASVAASAAHGSGS
jgi:signal transduction histidine kinase